MKKTIILILTVITLVSFGQESNESYFNKKTQHSISIEYLTASYSLAKKFSNDKIFGIRAKIGFARKFNIIPTSYKFTYYEPTEPLDIYTIPEEPEGITKTANIEFFDSLYDLIYLQLYRRLLLTEKLNLDLGVYTNLGYIDKDSENINEGLVGFGISSKLFFNIHRFHIGTGVDGGYNFITSPSVSKGFLGLYFSPLLLGYHF